MSNILTRYAARDAKRRARENNARTAEIQPLIEAALKEKNEYIASLEEALKAAQEENAALKEKIAALEAELAAYKTAEGAQTAENPSVGAPVEEATPTPAENAEAAEGGKKAAQKKGK